MKQEIRELLIREERARKQLIAPFLSSLGLTPGQGHATILYRLLQQDHITQKELAKQCRQDTATMSRNIDKLENSGFLIRENNPNCRRSFLICLTEKGKQEAEKIKIAFHQFEKILSKNISKDELILFAQVLEKICSNLENSDFL